MSSLQNLQFTNSFQRELPEDRERGPRRRQVYSACFSSVDPTPVSEPRLIAYSPEAARLIDLAPEECESAAFLDVFSGNRVLGDMQPYAACYGGHQFGNWAGQLGDGRAITLGEVAARNGQRWELQLKGAGATPYSRTADGRAVVRSSVREFLCSEAMFHLGVPTTRALCLIGTGDPVLRDMFYDGHPREEPGAVICRMAPSFLRFGNFEILAARNDLDTARSLADYTLRRHFAGCGSGPAGYTAFFEEVCRRTAVMVAHWMRVGFVHGVMNTDNMSVLGLTIDYGPYGWLEDFDPNWTPNTTDRGGRRYRFAHQPGVALWNLIRFAEALTPLVGATEPLERGLEEYERSLRAALRSQWLDKLGLAANTPDDDADPDRAQEDSLPLGLSLGDALVDELFRVLVVAETDMTWFFRQLAEVPATPEWLARADEALIAPLQAAYYVPEQLDAERTAQVAAWVRRYLRRVLDQGTPDAERRRRMNAVNPKFVLRNYLAQLAIDRVEAGDTGAVRELLDVLRHPYDEQPGKEAFAEKRPDWARHRPGCSMLSCSS
ncbi:MAG TPA: YdiU family protein [Polyangiaceae bacterium]|nr:YdiU family protein [Polyangiaceae bacterium]